MNRYLIILLLIAGCKKPKDYVRQTEIYYTASHHIQMVTDSIPLNYRLYSDYNDYMNNINPIVSVRLSGITDTTISIKVRQTDSLYFDIFSDDYTVTSWAIHYPSSRSFSASFAQLISGIQYSQANIQNLGTGRQTFINSNQPETKWYSTGVLNKYGNPVGDTITQNQRYIQLRIRKDGRYIATLKKEDGSLYTLSGDFDASGVNTMGVAKLFIRGENKSWHWNLYNTNHQPVGVGLPMDTCRLYNTKFCWIMVKEH